MRRGEPVAQKAHASRGDYYSDYWRSPELQMTEHLRWKLEVTRRHPRVIAARSVLDVGCGAGLVIAALREPGRRVCGVEMSAEAVRSLEERGMEGRAVDLEADRLPFGDGEFDVVLCYDVIEHVFAPGRLLAEIRRVVRPGGAVFLCVPNTLNLFNRMIFCPAGSSTSWIPRTTPTSSSRITSGFSPRPSSSASWRPAA